MDTRQSHLAERSPLLPCPMPSSSSSISSSKSFHSGSSDATSLGIHETIHLSKVKISGLALSIGLLIFLQGANMSILTTTQSEIAADLDAFEQATWLTSSYLVAMSSVSPLMGRFTQIFSPRNCIASSSVVMCLGLAIISRSSTLPVFLTGRIVTGAGAAGAFITATILVIQLAPTSHRGTFLGLVNLGMTSGISLGAVVAGALEPSIGWQALFGFQAPLTLLAGVCLYCSIPDSFDLEHRIKGDMTISQRFRRVDYLGALTLSCSIVLFLVGLSGHRVLIFPIALSFLTLPLFILNEIYLAREPIVPITVLKSRGTLFSCLATVGFMMARWAVLFYSPVFEIAVRDRSPAIAGSFLIPTNAGFGLGGILAGLLHIRRSGSFYLPTLCSMLVFPATLAILSLLATKESSSLLFVFLLFCNGLATGASLNYALVHLLHLTPIAVHPIVLSLLATFRGFAGSFGSAIGGGFFQRVLTAYLRSGFDERDFVGREDLIRRLIGSPALVRTLQGAERDVAQGAYQGAIRSLFLAGVCLSCVMVLLQSATGWKGPSTEGSTTEEEDNGVSEEDSLIA